MTYDVAVVGGGLSGATLACALAAEGADVAVVEAADASPSPPADGIDPRVSALGLAASRILEHLGVWQRLPPERLTPFREMHVWDATGAGSIHFDAADVGEPCLGHIVENSVVQQGLEASLTGRAGVTWHRPAELRAIAVEADGVRLRTSAGALRARLVVGADGSRSRVRDLAGIAVIGARYDQRAVVATLRSARHHAWTAWQRFLPDGPIALLPLPGQRVSMVWSTAPEHAEHLLAVPPETFAAEVVDAVDARLGALDLDGPRLGFDLVHQHAAEYAVERIALVGDAAHTIHPLAGQGANLGLLDAAALAEVVNDVQRCGRDPGRRSNLRRYERWRKGHNLLMEAAMSGFHRLFGSDAETLRRARNTGLGLVDRAVPLKRLFMRRASGLVGDLPRLARVQCAPFGDVERRA